MATGVFRIRSGSHFLSPVFLQLPCADTATGIGLQIIHFFNSPVFPRFLRVSCRNTCFVNTHEERNLTPSFTNSSSMFSPSLLMVVTFQTVAPAECNHSFPSVWSKCQ